MIDKTLVLELITKHRYKGQTNWDNLTNDYNSTTGEQRSKNSLRSIWTRLSKSEKQLLDSKSLSFNERTDNIIQEPHNLLTENDILIAMGLCPKEFMLNNSNTLNRWWLDNDSEEINKRIRNGQLKIGFKKRVEVITLDSIKNIVKDSDIKPVIINSNKDISKEELLEIPLFDMHFGINDYEGYKEHQEQILELITEKKREEHLYIIGQDLMHNDNLRSQTSSGTIIEKVDMKEALENAKLFYYPLIEASLQNADKVKIIYSRGNHDETVSWLFCEMLHAKYPQVEFNLDPYQEHKYHVYHNVFLGYTHGHRTNDKKIAQIFNAKFRLLMAQAKRRIIKRGHLHTNVMIDDFGTLIIGLGTSAETDMWHDENGYVGNNKSFEVFIYSKDTLRQHIYIE